MTHNLNDVLMDILCRLADCRNIMSTTTLIEEHTKHEPNRILLSQSVIKNNYTSREQSCLFQHQRRRLKRSKPIPNMIVEKKSSLQPLNFHKLIYNHEHSKYLKDDNRRLVRAIKRNYLLLEINRLWRLHGFTDIPIISKQLTELELYSKPIVISPIFPSISPNNNYEQIDDNSTISHDNSVESEKNNQSYSIVIKPPLHMQMMKEIELSKISKWKKERSNFSDVVNHTKEPVIKFEPLNKSHVQTLNNLLNIFYADFQSDDFIDVTPWLQWPNQTVIAIGPGNIIVGFACSIMQYHYLSRTKLTKPQLLYRLSDETEHKVELSQENDETENKKYNYNEIRFCLTDQLFVKGKLRNPRCKQVYLPYVFILPNWRKVGIGKKMLTLLLKQIIRQRSSHEGFTIACIHVPTTDCDTLIFFQMFGFKILKKIIGFYKNFNYKKIRIGCNSTRCSQHLQLDETHLYNELPTCVPKRYDAFLLSLVL
ncbi:hypothetical protein SNEBB_002234 [Seison nebaliae]|nr:hypothetical protein SNEBB_002234 [Seison nebaliae]